MADRRGNGRYLFGRGGFLDVAFFHVPPQKIFIHWFFILFYSVFAAVLTVEAA
jgi:hypothetical protein